MIVEAILFKIFGHAWNRTAYPRWRFILHPVCLLAGHRRASSPYVRCDRCSQVPVDLDWRWGI